MTAGRARRERWCLLKLTSAEADFVDPIDTLVEAGEIAALLRY